MSFGSIVHLSNGQKRHSVKNKKCFPDIEHSSIVLSEWEELIYLSCGSDKAVRSQSMGTHFRSLRLWRSPGKKLPWTWAEGLLNFHSYGVHVHLHRYPDVKNKINASFDFLSARLAQGDSFYGKLVDLSIQPITNTQKGRPLVSTAARIHARTKR